VTIADEDSKNQSLLKRNTRQLNTDNQHFPLLCSTNK